MHLPTFSDAVKSRWTVKKDECGDEYIKLNGRTALPDAGLDHIYKIDTDKLGVWLTRRNTKRILDRIPGSKIEQGGDDEVVISCGIEHLDLLCQTVGAKRRMQLSDAQRFERSRHAKSVLCENPRKFGT